MKPVTLFFVFLMVSFLLIAGCTTTPSSPPSAPSASPIAPGTSSESLSESAIWHEKGFDLLDAGQNQDAILAFDRAISIDPENVHAWNGKGNALLNLGDYSEALKAFDRAISLDTKYAHAYIGRGNVLYRLKKFNESLEEFDRAIALDPNITWAWNGKGTTYLELGMTDEAATAFDRAIALDPRNPHAWAGRGYLLLKLGNNQEALDAFTEALSIDPNNKPAQDGKEQALNPGDGGQGFDAATNRGFELLGQGKNTEALQSFTSAISSNPDNYDAWNGKGIALSNLGKTNEALGAFNEAISLNANYSKPYVGKGNIYYSQQRYDDALAAFEKSISLNPDDAPAWAGKGQALIQLDRCDEAEDALTKALSLDSKLGWARDGLNKLKDPSICNQNMDSQQPVTTSLTSSGYMAHNETWSGTIRVTGEIWLGRDVTLKIEPGTTVYLTANRNDQHPSLIETPDEYIEKYSDPVGLASWSSNAITIDGRDGIIDVRGTPENPVIFRPEGDSTSPGQWNGIYVGRGTIQNARILYAGRTAVNIFGDYPGTVEISRNEVKYFHWAGIDSHRKNVWIHDNIVEGGGHQGIGVWYNTVAENNIVSRAQTGMSANDASGAIIRHNTVIDCPVGIGLRSGTSAEVTDNTILKQNGYPDGWYYKGTLIYPAGAAGWGAIVNYPSMPVKMENNTILI